MRKIYSSINNFEVQLLKNVLEDAGIACMVQNENLSMGMGEIPFTECCPELWVARDEEYDRAVEVLGNNNIHNNDN